MPIYTHHCRHGHQTRDIVMPMANAGVAKPFCQVCGMTMRRVFVPPQVLDDTLRIPHRFIDLPSERNPKNLRAHDTVTTRSARRDYLRRYNEKHGTQMRYGDS